MLGRLGVNVHIVACQEKPDGDFKTCEYPNPETDAALAESYKVADNAPCDVILGTDPDADRIAIAVPTGNGYQKLTGNELGCLIMDYVLKARSEKQDIPDGAIVVRSIVSSPLADRIAEHYGVDMKTVLTGFKYIGGEVLKLEEIGRSDRFIFGFEESCGYLKGTYARDKDAVIAAILVCEIASSLKAEGKTILDALNKLYSTYGMYLSRVHSLEIKGLDAMEKAAKMMSDLRDDIPEKIGGAAVTSVRDYRTSVDNNLVTGEQKVIQLPKSNVLEFVLGQRGSVIVRPSGTEPKVKFYYTAVAQSEEEANILLDAMVAQMEG